MQKRLLCALVGMALLMTLCMNVLAAYSDNSSPREAAQTQPETAVGGTADMFGVLTEVSATASKLIESNVSLDALDVLAEGTGLQEAAGAKLWVNGVPLGTSVKTKLIGESTYISMRAIVEALDPTAAISWRDGQFHAAGNGFTMTARPGDLFMVVNGRYLYVPNGILYENSATFAPLRTVCNAVGASTSWEMMTGTITVTTTGSPLNAGSSFYNHDDLYWLSRIIEAESKNQPLNGKVAVGAVILNRVTNPQFPNSIYDVIFQPNQFQPVQNGSIYDLPSQESVIAAKLALEGAVEAGGSLFFNRAGLDCWASRTKTYVTTIADHSFYR